MESPEPPTFGGVSSPEAWYLLASGAGPAAWNMAVDEVLLANAIATGRPVLRFYGWNEPAATFGYSQHFATVAALTKLRPLIRRLTGGGLVPHDSDWTYSLAIPPLNPWYALRAEASYWQIHDWLRRALAHCGITTELAPVRDPSGAGQCFVGAEKSDLLLGSSKIAGAAQRRNRQGLLIQGSIQTPPKRLSRGTWESAMQVALPGGSFHFENWTLPEIYSAAATQAVAARYGNAAYNKRR